MKVSPACDNRLSISAGKRDFFFSRQHAIRAQVVSRELPTEGLSSTLALDP